jgi:hypothetical protein
MLRDDIIPTLLSRGSHGYETTLLKKGEHAYAVPFYNEPRPVLIDLVLWRDEHWGKHYLNFVDQDGLLVASESYHPLLGDGERYLAETAGKPYNADGDFVGAIETVRDLTDVKNLEQEREQLITKLKAALAKVKILGIRIWVGFVRSEGGKTTCYFPGPTNYCNNLWHHI